MAESEPSGSAQARYDTFVQNFGGLCHAVQNIVDEVAVKAFSKRLITVVNKQEAENGSVAEFKRTSKFLEVIMSKINEKAAHFDTFVEILREVDLIDIADKLMSVDSGTSKSFSSEHSDTGSSAVGQSAVKLCGFQCPCGNCTLESYLRNRSSCSLHKVETFPYLDLGCLCEGEREELECRLLSEANTAVETFQSFMDNVFDALKENKIPVEDIICTVFSSGESLPRQIQNGHGDELKSITKVSDVQTFLVQHKYVSFFNYRILVRIIERFFKVPDSEVRLQLNDYLIKFREFCRRNVFEIPTSFLNTSSPSDQLLVVKVNNDMWFGNTENSPFTVNDMRAIEAKIAEVLQLNHDRGYINLVDVRKGCLQLSFAILSICQEVSVFPLSTSQLSELISAGIIVWYQSRVQSPTKNTDSENHHLDIPNIVDTRETPRSQSLSDRESWNLDTVNSRLSVTPVLLGTVSDTPHTDSDFDKSSTTYSQSAKSSETFEDKERNEDVPLRIVQIGKDSIVLVENVYNDLTTNGYTDRVKGILKELEEVSKDLVAHAKKQVKDIEDAEEKHKLKIKEYETKCGQLNLQERNYESQLTQARYTLQIKQNELSSCRSELSNAESNLRDAERELSKAKSDAVSRRGGGAVLGAIVGTLFLPGVGTALGAAAGLGAGEMINQDEERSARSRVEECRNRCSSAESAQSSAQSQVYGLESNIAMISSQIGNLKAQQKQFNDKVTQLKRAKTFFTGVLEFWGDFQNISERSDCTAILLKIMNKAKEIEDLSWINENQGGNQNTTRPFMEAWEIVETKCGENPQIILCF